MKLYNDWIFKLYFMGHIMKQIYFQKVLFLSYELLFRVDKPVVVVEFSCIQAELWFWVFVVTLGTSNFLLAKLCIKRSAVQIVLDHNFPQVIVETDCLEEIQLAFATCD